MPPESVLEQFRTSGEQGFIHRDELERILLSSWGQMLQAYLEDGVLSEQEQAWLDHLYNVWDFKPDQLEKAGGLWTTRVQAIALRSVMAGHYPDQHGIVFEGLPFTLQKNERFIWAWPNVELLEQKVVRTRVAGSRGASIRVMKGVYYHVGATRAHTIESLEMRTMGIGTLAFTNKHLYWGGGMLKSIRVQWDKIINLDSYSDGLGIMRDAASARPQVFRVGPRQGWFLMNLASNARNLE